MAKNSNLHAAKAAKNDEFYTQLTDIEKELAHYKEHFGGGIVLCNCDDPTYSNFWRYFHLNFGFLGLKKLISTHYDPEKPTYKLEYTGGDDSNIEAGVMTPLKQNGDFRSEECIELLKEADIVVTNPPFSLFRSYVAQLMEYGKKFIIIGNMNAVTYKEFFPLLKNNQIWLGYTSPKEFLTPDGGVKKFGNIFWYTNLDHPKRHEPLKLWRKYADDPKKYPKYDNYDAINVDKTDDIPIDYDGVMGVPISFLDKYCPEQFEIVGLSRDMDLPGKTGMKTEFVNAYFQQGNTGQIMEGHPDLGYYDKDGKTIVPYRRVMIQKRSVTKKCETQRVNGDLKGTDIIQGYYEKLSSQNISDRYAALGFALQLPGICGRIENPKTDENTEQKKSAQKNAKEISGDNLEQTRALYGEKHPKDSNIYLKWFEDHAIDFELLFEDSSDIKAFAKHVYELRNAYTHEGIVKTQNSNIILVDGKIKTILCTDNYLFMSIDDFCKIVFRVAKNIFEQHNTSFSSFQSCGMDADSYTKLLKKANEKRVSFWDAHTQEEQSLSMVYNRVFLDDAAKLQEANEFFIAHPEGKYRIEQFSRKYRLAMPSDNYVIFEKKYDNYQGNMCEFNKQQFEQMCAINAEIQEYNADLPNIIKNFLHNT